MHLELALNRYKLVSALIEISSRLQTSLRTRIYLGLNNFTLVYKTKPSNSGNHVRSYSHLQQSGQEQLKCTLEYPQAWCSCQALSYLIAPVVLLLLPIWISPGFSLLSRNIIWAQCKHWQGLMQAVQMSSSQGTPRPKKQALPTSEPCLSPAMPWGIKDCTCYTHGAAERLTARTWGWQLLLSLLSQHWVPSCRHHKEKGANPARVHRACITLLRGDSWGHTSFLGEFV